MLLKEPLLVLLSSHAVTTVCATVGGLVPDFDIVSSTRIQSGAPWGSLRGATTALPSWPSACISEAARSALSAAGPSARPPKPPGAPGPPARRSRFAAATAAAPAAAWPASGQTRQAGGHARQLDTQWLVAAAGSLERCCHTSAALPLTSGCCERYALAAGYGMRAACTLLLAATMLAPRRLWLPPAGVGTHARAGVAGPSSSRQQQGPGA